MLYRNFLVSVVALAANLVPSDAFVPVARSRHGYGRTSLMSSMSSMSSMPSSSMSSLSSTPQMLEFQEPTTNTTVILVGSMHYNPTSMNLARTTIDKLGKENRLGSVLVESCDIRWDKTTELYKRRPILKKIMNSEMRLAADAALSYDRPVVLGDQRINITSDALKSSLKETFADLTSPPSGWKRFITELKQSYDETLPLGGKGAEGKNDGGEEICEHIRHQAG